MAGCHGAARTGGAQGGEFVRRSVDRDTEVTITAGATEAIFCAITAVVRPGDEVIVFDPAYDCYEPAVTLAGGVTRHVPLVAPSFTPDWDRVRDALTKRTRLLIINTPHNPTGSIWREADMQALRDLARDHDFYHRRRRGVRTHRVRRRCATKVCCGIRICMRAASSCRRSARRFTPPAGRSAIAWRRRR